MVDFFKSLKKDSFVTPIPLLSFVETPALQPPEFIISAQDAQALEQELAAAASAPLPDDDDDL